MRLRLGASGADRLFALGAIGHFWAAPQLHRRNGMPPSRSPTDTGGCAYTVTATAANRTAGRGPNEWRT
jgi:hypothetical protein